MRFLHPRNWSVYSRKLSGDKEALRQYKRIILLSQFTLFGSVVGVLHAVEDLVYGMVFMPLMDLTMAAGVFVCHLLNERGKYKLAKISLLAFLNLFFFVYASLVPKDLGIYFYYFPWVGLAAVVFENKENPQRLFFICLSVLFIILLFVTDFNPFGPFEFAAVYVGQSFIINLVSSMAVLVFFIVFMVSMNEYSEKKLESLAEEIRIKNGHLQKINRELDRFFYSTTHDLKMPLMDMKGIIYAAMTDVKDRTAFEYFVLLKERAQDLDTFLQDVIDYSRNTQTALQLEPVNIEHLVDEAISNFRFVNDADRIRFEKDILLDHPVEIDRLRLLNILSNIFSNAIKYQRPDIKDPWVKVGAHFFENKLNLYIADNGQGMHPDVLPKIFNMFFRGTDQSKGSGLGLYIVKETIEKMGGSIEVRSTPGLGTYFTIVLPATVPVKQEKSLLKDAATR
jgi:signal transduction histidine kinase